MAKILADLNKEDADYLTKILMTKQQILIIIGELEDRKIEVLGQLQKAKQEQVNFESQLKSKYNLPKDVNYEIDFKNKKIVESTK